MKPFEEWLFKARQDYETARVLLANAETLDDTAVYHTQQSAEKALKGFLLYNGKPIERTHNVRYLLTIACDIDSSLESLSESVYLVAPFDTLYRYPGQELMPTREVAERAVGAAKEILICVEQLMNS